MCGFNEWPKKDVDIVPRSAIVWAVKARYQEMAPDDVFRLRTKLKMTQRQFADLVGVDPITISRWERGVTKMERAMITHVRAQADEYKRIGR